MCYTFCMVFDARCIDVQCFSTGVSVPVIKDRCFVLWFALLPFCFVSILGWIVLCGDSFF